MLRLSRQCAKRAEPKLELTSSRRRQMWPHIFTREVPYALPLCRWAAREGAFVHPALFLRRHPMGGNFVVTRRKLAAGTPLMTLPLSIVIATSTEERSPGISTPMEQLVHIFARGLHDQTCPWYTYLQFLHDSYNDDDLLDVELDDTRLEAELDMLLDGNAVNILGVPNAPFMEKRQVATTRSRVDVDRAATLVRHVKQAVPYFASSCVPWAMSMAMSRGVSEENGEVSVFPLIDLCNHSFNPAAHYYVSTPLGDDAKRSDPSAAGSVVKRNRGVKGWVDREPAVHLLAVRDIAAMESVSLMYSDENPHRQEEDAEAAAIADRWQTQWGFVPDDDAPRKRPGTRRKVGEDVGPVSREVILERVEKLLKR